MSISRAAVDAAYAKLLAAIAAAERDDDDAPFRAEALGTCTVTAAHVARALGGAVYGYEAQDNPAAELGRLEGGHDFALIEERFIVDWWASAYPALDQVHPGVIDLHDPAWAAQARAWYGPRQRWGRLGLV